MPDHPERTAVARIRIFTLIAAALAWGHGATAADTSPLPAVDYTVSASWALGGSGGGESLAFEPGRARLFVSRGDRIEVIESASGKVAAAIPYTSGVHGIALAPALKRGFTSNSRANTVSAFDLDSLRVIQEVSVPGRRPDSILYDGDQNHVITANGESADLTVLDASTLQIVGSVALPGIPGFMARVSGMVYVNIGTDPGKLLVLDGKTLAIKATWPLAGCSKPTALAADAAHRRLFSVCANQVLAVTDAASGKQVARPAIGAGSAGAAFDPDLGLVFSSNGGDGTLTVIREESPDEYRVLASVTTQTGARTLALDPATHRIYLAAAGGASNSFAILIAQPK
jgi:DNA-binding beta-propeller fold protein YncE